MSKKVYKVRIGEAAEAFGVSPATVRRWETSGKITAERTPGGQRRYDLSALLPDKFSCEAKQVEVVILNQGQDTTFEEDLATDVLEIITVFSARLYGSRSHKNKKLLDDIKQAVSDSQP